jgi:hypothetical protein
MSQIQSDGAPCAAKKFLKRTILFFYRQKSEPLINSARSFVSPLFKK